MRVQVCACLIVDRMESGITKDKSATVIPAMLEKIVRIASMATTEMTKVIVFLFPIATTECSTWTLSNAIAKMGIPNQTVLIALQAMKKSVTNVFLSALEEKKETPQANVSVHMDSTRMETESAKKFLIATTGISMLIKKSASVTQDIKANFAINVLLASKNTLKALEFA